MAPDATSVASPFGGGGRDPLAGRPESRGPASSGI
jgi:hypothetical protein